MAVQQMMRIESDIVFGVTVEFAKRGILALPVHDSLLMPEAMVDEAEWRLAKRFCDRVGVVPRISVSKVYDEVRV